MIFELLFLFGAGFLGGILNSIAGGGSFITFPALLAVGVAPISANATNTFASCAGYLSGAYALKDELRAYKKELTKLILTSFIGGALGAWLLLKTPESLFRETIPWLLLLATLLFIFGAKINRMLKQSAVHLKHASLFAGVLLVFILLSICVYGGFFNAGLGIVVLSYLALSGHSNINAMNAMKLLISSTVSIIAVILFIFDGVIAWQEGGAVLIGTLLGGYLAAHISKQLPQQYIRSVVIIVSCCITVYFFIDTYSI